MEGKTMATTDKYDRQLRLWGSSGQRALGETLVLLIGSSACGTETLKNLVLPGVGSFAVVDDDENCTAADAKAHDNPDLTDSVAKFSSQSSNFFLPPSSNQDRLNGNLPNFGDGDGNGDTLSNAAQVCALLSELNPDVHGYHYTVPSLEEINFVSFLKGLIYYPPKSNANGAAKPKKILAICADQPSSVTLPLSHACHTLSIPLLVVRSYGLLGYVRIQTACPYHAIIEAKPSHRIPDLRLSAWPLFDGLKCVDSSIENLDDMEDSKDHSHVPFVVILLQALRKWRGASCASDSNSGPVPTQLYPKQKAEKDAFRELVRAMAKNISNEANFEEAVREAHLVWADGKISDNVKMVLDGIDEELFFGSAIRTEMDVEGEAANLRVPPHILQFQLLALALKRFLEENDGYPPIEGTIPDMTSDTIRYVALQEAYKQQAEKDKSKLNEVVNSLINECRQKSNGCDINIVKPSNDEISTLCKNARYLSILETRPFYAEYKIHDPSSPVVSDLFDTFFSPQMPNFEMIQSDARASLLMATFDPYEADPIQTPLLWWIALRACDAFYDRHEHYPGNHEQELALEADTNDIYKHMVQIVTSLGLNDSDFIKEHLLDQAKGKDLAREVVRYGEAEIHNIAAVVGGVASQEAVKLITGQYVPFDDTYVYNGISSTAGVYRF